MAFLQKELALDVPAEAVWDALKDVGALHERLVRGFVTACRLDGDVRTLTFANGLIAKERILDVDDSARRLAYSVVEGRPSYYHATVQVFPVDERRSRLVWTIDVLPNELRSALDGMMNAGVAAMKRTLEAS